MTGLGDSLPALRTFAQAVSLHVRAFSLGHVSALLSMMIPTEGPVVPMSSGGHGGLYTVPEQNAGGDETSISGS